MVLVLVCFLFSTVAVCCGTVFRFGTVHCFIAVFRGSCLALWSPCRGNDRWLLYFSLVSGVCTVYQGLFALPLSVIGRLWAVIVAIPGIFCTFVQSTLISKATALDIKCTARETYFIMQLYTAVNRSLELMYTYQLHYHPAGTQHWNNVDSTSASVLNRPCAPIRLLFVNIRFYACFMCTLRSKYQNLSQLNIPKTLWATNAKKYKGIDIFGIFAAVLAIRVRSNLFMASCLLSCAPCPFWKVGKTVTIDRITSPLNVFYSL